MSGAQQEQASTQQRQLTALEALLHETSTQQRQMAEEAALNPEKKDKNLEAIELARDFGTTESPGFVNAILDKLAKAPL